MTRGLVRSGLWVAGATLASRVLGFVRDAVLAASLGAGPAAEAFVLAFRLPNLCRRMLAEGMLAQGLVPILVALRIERGNAAAGARLCTWLATALLLGLALVLTAPSWLPYWLSLLAPGYTDDSVQRAWATRWALWMLPFIALSGLAAVLAAGLQARHQVARVSLAPVVLNSVLLLAMALVWAWPDPARGDAIALAVSIGGGCQVLFLGLAYRHSQTLPGLAQAPVQATVAARPHTETKASGAFLAALFASAVGQLNGLVATALATLLAPGSLAYLFYADRLVEFPQALAASALAMVLLPRLAQARAQADPAGYHQVLEHALVLTILVAGPAGLGLWMLSEAITAGLFLYGQMRPEDTVAAAVAVRAYAVALVPLCMGRILLVALLTTEAVRAVWVYAVLGLVVHGLAAILLGEALGYAGIALATALAATAQVAYALHVLPGEVRGVLQGTLRALPPLALASGVMLAVLTMLCPDMEDYVTNSPWGRGLRLLAVIGLALMSYAGMLILLRPAHPALGFARLGQRVTRS